MDSRTGRFASLALLISLAAAGTAASQCPSDLGSVFPSTAPRRGICSLLVDDDSAARTGYWGPWTEAPTCTYREGKDDEDEEVKYCVYTSGIFNFGQGLSLLTRPEMAAQLAAAIQDPQQAWLARRHLGRRVDSPPAEGIKYEVKEIPGKGMGVIATQPIRQAEVFMTGLPSLLIDERLDSIADMDFEEERNQIYRVAFDNLPGRDRVLSLARSKGGDLVDDIMGTNSFIVAIPGANHNALFPEVSRVNHACDPNASARFSPTKLTMDVMAIKDIEVGEEVTFSYIPWGLPSVQREYLTNKMFGFKCTCPLCSLPEKERDESDARRNQLQQIEKTLKGGQEHYEAAVQLTERLLVLANQERLVGKMKEFCLDLMAVFYDYGDVEGALYFAENALRHSELYDEAGGDVAVGIAQNVAALRSLMQSRKQANA